MTHIRFVVPGRAGEAAPTDVPAGVRALGDGVFEVAGADLGLGLDVDATLARAKAVGHSGSVIRRVERA